MKQIYVHGLGQKPESWQGVMEQLHTDEACICPDLSDLVRGKEVTYPNLYTAFSAVCDAVGEPFALCGLSLGGVLALHYATEHPDRVKALVLIGAQYKMPEHLLRFQNAVFRFLPKAAFRSMGFEKDEVLKLCKTMRKLDFSDSLDKISCPSLIVCGERDQANKRAAAELAGRLPHGRLAELCGVGHEVNTEAPEKLAKLLREFYSDQLGECENGYALDRTSDIAKI